MSITPAPTGPSSATPSQATGGSPTVSVAATTSTAGVKNWGAKAVDQGGLVVWAAAVVSMATLVLLWWSESFL